MTYRILTLDGGGSWALLEVMALAKIYGEGATGHDVLKDFDLVAANSGGSITLGGLIEDYPLASLRDDLFLNEAARKKIFASRGIFSHIVQDLVHLGPKYSTVQKLAGLKGLFPKYGGVSMSKLRDTIGAFLPEIVICGFDYDRLRGVLFRTNPKSLAADVHPEFDLSLAEAAHASSNAPINYFDIPAALPEAKPVRQFWDGGIAGYNNPVLIAVTEALANGHAAGDIRALSLGTGTKFLPFDAAGDFGVLGQPSRQLPRSSGLEDLISDVATLAASITDDPPDVASFIAHVALGGRLPRVPGDCPVSGPVVRMNPMIQPAWDGQTWVVPAGISDFDKLAHLDMDAIAQEDVLRILEFGEAWLNDTVANQPIRTDRITLGCEVGEPTFGGALAHWSKIGRAAMP